MVENNHYTSNSQEEDELEIDLMVYVRKLWNARKQLLKVAGIAAIATTIYMAMRRKEDL